MNKGFGVTVTRSNGQGGAAEKMALVVVARDELDAEAVAAKLVGPEREAEIFRQLTDDEVAEYGLDLAVHGSAKALAVPNL
jgi:hypothetical protein